MVRVATYAKDIDKAIHLGNHVRDLGYEVSVNVMAVSHVLEPDLDEALAQLAKTKFQVVYLVDSFGYFYSEQIQYLAKKYLSVLRPAGIEVGVHMHNNIQLGFANTVEGIIQGINYLDATVYGMGRAAGNCPLELLVDFLKNPKFDVRPILDLIQKYFVDMKQDLRWGYEIPYAITGLLNKHPRAALAYMKGAHATRSASSMTICWKWRSSRCPRNEPYHRPIPTDTIISVTLSSLAVRPHWGGLDMDLTWLKWLVIILIIVASSGCSRAAA